MSLFTTILNWLDPEPYRPTRQPHHVYTSESTTYRLYLGGQRHWLDQQIAERDLQQFLRFHVAPHFPTFTVYQAQGYYNARFEKVWVLELVILRPELELELAKRIQEIGHIWAEREDQLEVFINCFKSGSTRIIEGKTSYPEI